MVLLRCLIVRNAKTMNESKAGIDFSFELLLFPQTGKWLDDFAFVARPAGSIEGKVIGGSDAVLDEVDASMKGVPIEILCRGTFRVWAKRSDPIEESIVCTQASISRLPDMAVGRHESRADKFSRPIDRLFRLHAYRTRSCCCRGYFAVCANEHVADKRFTLAFFHGQKEPILNE